VVGAEHRPKENGYGYEDNANHGCGFRFDKILHSSTLQIIVSQLPL